MNFRYKFGARGEKRWIVLGDFIDLFDYMSFFKSYRALAERFAMHIMPTSIIDHRHAVFDALKELQEYYPNIKSALLYYTGDYKHSHFIGIIVTAADEKIFIKKYKNATPLFNDEHDIFNVDGIKTSKGRTLSPTLHTFDVIEGHVISDVDTRFENMLLKICAQQAQSAENGLCWAHGDLNRQNVMRDENNDYVIIDFERYGVHPPFYDWFHYKLKEPLYNKKLELFTRHELARPIMDFGYSHNEALSFLEQYLLKEQELCIEATKHHVDARLEVKKERLGKALKEYIQPDILMIHQGHDLYGSGRVFVNTAQMWREHYGKANIVLDLPEAGSLSAKVKDTFSIRYGKTWIARKFLFKKSIKEGLDGFWTSLRQAFHDLKHFDTVYVNTITPLTYIIAATFSSKSPIFHVHEIPSLFVRIAFSIVFAVARPRLIFVSNTTRAAYYLAPWLKYAIVPNSFDGTFKPKKRTSLQHVNILAIGRINPQKGWLVLADALHKLSDEDKARVHVRFVGDTYKNQQYMYDDLVNHLKGLPDGMIELHAFSPNPKIHYEWSDITVIPSLVAESFGLVAVEAMAAGCAVIASDSGALPELIPEGVGIITKSGDSDELSSAITNLIHSPETISRLGKASKKHSKRYSKSVFNDNLRAATLKWNI